MKNTFRGNQASKIEIQTFLLIILIAIFPLISQSRIRPPGPVLDSKIPQSPNWDPSGPPVWTTVSLRYPKPVMMGVFDGSIAAVPKALQ